MEGDFTMSKRDELLERIDNQLRRIEMATKTRNPMEASKGSADIAIQACCKLLNHIYNYSLADAENLSGIHLIDTEHRVAIQLCTQATRLELQETVERLLPRDARSRYDMLIILITEYTAVHGIRDGFDENNLQILYLSDLMQVIRFLPSDILENITSSLNKQFQEKKPNASISITDFDAPIPIENLTPEMRQVLFFFSFLPEEGLIETLLRHALNHAQQRAVNELLDKNWLVRRNVSLLRNPKAIALELELEQEEALAPAFSSFLDLLWYFERSWRWYRFSIQDHETIFRRLATLFQNAAGWKYGDTYVCVRRSAEFCMKIGEYDEAKQQMLQVLHAQKPRGRDDQWTTAYFYHLIALCYYMLQHYEDARRYWRKSLEKCRSISVSPADQAVAHHNLGTAYIKMEKYPSAIEEFNNVARLLEPTRTCGDKVFPHKRLADAYHALSFIYQKQGLEKKKEFYKYKAMAANQEDVQLSDKEMNNLADPPPKHSLPGIPSASIWFREGSRERELNELEYRFRNSDSPLFIYGAEGTGKTEVAIRLANRIGQPGRSFYIRYCDASDGGEAMRATILQAEFSNYLFQDEDSADRQKEYRERMDILKSEYPKTVLIVDNFDLPGKKLEELQSEESYYELTTMGIRLIFVTRSDASTQNGIEIQHLGEDVLMELMRDALGSKPASYEVLSRLICVAGEYPLLLTMAANALSCEDGPKPEQLLDLLNCVDTDSDAPPPGGSPQQIPYKVAVFLEKMLALSGMDEDNRTALGCAVLLPEAGMRKSLFLECLPLKMKFSEKRLIDYGFLRIDQDMLVIHPLVRDFCLQHLVLDDDVYSAYCKNLWEKFSKDRACEAEIIRQIAESFDMAVAKLHDPGDDLLYLAALCWNRLGIHHRALQKNLRALELWRQSYGPETLAMSKIHKSAGDAYRRLGMLDKAQQHYTAALRISNETTEAQEMQKYYVRTSLFDVVIKQGKYEEALKYAEDNLEYVKSHVHRYESLAAVYYHMCQVYIKMEDYETANENLDVLLDICKSPDLKNDESLSRYFSCAALVYTALAKRKNEPARWKDAREYQHKALEIHERILPQDHPVLATSYINMGIICSSLGDHYKALEYRLKAMAIREKVLPRNHPNLASVYSGVGDSYYAMGDLDHALEYREKALYIRKEVLSYKHPDLINSYNIVGYTLLEQGNYDQAQPVLEQLLQILQIDPAGNRMLFAVTNSRIGILHSELMNYEDAERYLLEALKTFREIKELDSLHMANTYSNLGYTLFFQRKYPEALAYLSEALIIARERYATFHPEVQKLTIATNWVRSCAGG